MLSKKMAFSLMSLITIFALAFAVPSAMAGDFDVKIMGPTVATYTGDGTAAIPPFYLTVMSDQSLPMTLTAAPGADAANPTNTITVDAYDENGFSVPKTDGLPTGITSIADLATDGTPPFPGRTSKVRRLLITLDVAANTGIASFVITIPAFETPDNRVGDDDDMSKEVKHTVTIKMVAPMTAPKVVSIQRLRPGSQTVVAAFQEAIITDASFDVRIVFTEKWNVDLAKIDDILAITNGTASNVVAGVPFEMLMVTAGTASTTYRPHPSEGQYEHTLTTGVPPGVLNSGNVPEPTGEDGMYHQYRVTITPHTKSEDFEIKIHVKEFRDDESPYLYTPEGVEGKPNGREQLRLMVKGNARDLTAGYKVTIPKDWIIPANGYLIIAKSKAGSAIDTSGQDSDRTNDTPRATHRRPAQLLYNVYETGALPNLATAFLNGVVVDVESQHAGLVISEVMWGEDVSLNPSTSSQYIELYNPGGQYKTVDDADHTPDVNEALTLIFYAPNEFADVPAVDADGNLPAGITDRIGTLDTKGAYWSPATKGRSGRSGIPIERLEERGADAAVAVEIIPTIATGDVVPIVSMYRVMAADGTIDTMMGQMSASWMSSVGPKSANFRPIAIGVRHGTPGAATDSTVTPADTAAEAKAKADAEAAAAAKTASTGTYPMGNDGRVYISEIMFDRGNALPQWIEIANGDRAKTFNLSGWTLTVDNATADDVDVGASIKFTIPNGTTIDPSGQDDTPSTLLVVTESGHTNIDDGPGTMGEDQIINLWQSNQTELVLAGVTKRRYSLLSDMAFQITLAPPAPAQTNVAALAATATAAEKATAQQADREVANALKAATDMVGNLGDDGAAAWALPMSEEGGRSSIIRTHVDVSVGPAEPLNKDGTMMEDWVLASDTAFADPVHIRVSSYYGAMSDVGTPGFRAGGALPVELSHFRPERQKDTGAVVITWSTESELNNAGFFIKRSQQADGEFTVINAAMVPGAGTTSEKQFYTYTDTTAQPNVVYYYQIEDVSLDGNRQTLTRGIRLRGHVGAAGKATVTWGELKTSHE